MVKPYLLGFAGVTTTVAVSAAGDNYKKLFQETMTTTS